jgi:demethylmenaquinone methyltransferase/2-methoxy-6-polyprenyl-1,4-benzoquinol methylase
LSSQKIDGDAKIMDMATGTADFAIEAVRMGLTEVHITGVDISPGMLDVGRQKDSESAAGQKKLN